MTQMHSRIQTSSLRRIVFDSERLTNHERTMAEGKVWNNPVSVIPPIAHFQSFGVIHVARLARILCLAEVHLATTTTSFFCARSEGAQK